MLLNVLNIVMYWNTIQLIIYKKNFKFHPLLFIPLKSDHLRQILVLYSEI